MKRLLLALCLLISTQVISAQIITSRNVIVERTVINEPPTKKGSYRGFIEFAPGVSFGSEKILAIDLLTTHGYQFNHWLFLGGGIGIVGTLEEEIIISDKEEENKDAHMALSMPLYVDVRFYTAHAGVKPFFNIKLGGLIPLNEFTTKLDPKSDYSERSNFIVVQKNGGFYSSFGFGIENRHFTWSITYGIRGIHSEYDTLSPSLVKPKTINPGVLSYNFAVNF